MYSIIRRNDTIYVEKVNFDDLKEDEKDALQQGQDDFIAGRTVRLEEVTE